MEKIKKNLAVYIQSGEETGTEKTAYHCQICQDRGYLVRGDVAFPCQCQDEKDRLKRQKKAGITPKLAQYTFDRFDLKYYSSTEKMPNGLSQRESAKRTLQSAKKFVAESVEGKRNGGMLLEGAVGCGKTFLAAAIANELLRFKKDVRFLVVPDFLDEIRYTYSERSAYREQDLMERVKRVEILILDDFGAHNYTDWTVKTLFAVLNYRINQDLPIIVTTNLSDAERGEILGTRIQSRLIEACRSYRMDATDDIRVIRRQEEMKRTK